MKRNKVPKDLSFMEALLELNPEVDRKVLAETVRTVSIPDFLQLIDAVIKAKHLMNMDKEEVPDSVSGFVALLCRVGCESGQKKLLLRFCEVILESLTEDMNDCLSFLDEVVKEHMERN